MKKILLSSLFSIIITACANATSAPAITQPAPAESVAATIPAIEIPTATPIPETAEQRGERLAQVVNWNPNDETKWVIPSGLSAEDAAFLQEMQAINADPNTKTKEQLVAYDQFVTDMRRAFLSGLPGQDAAALEQMTNEEISAVMYDWSAENKVAFMPTHVELWRWNDSLAKGNENKDTHYATIVAEDGTLLGTRYNGLWMDRSNDIAFTYPNSPHLARYANTLFGEEHEWVGNLGFDTHMAVLRNVLRLPYGQPGYDATIIGLSGTMYHLPTVVGLEGEEGLTAYAFYDTGRNDSVVTRKVRWESELYTRLKIGNGVYRPLTLEDLFNGINHRIVWTPSNEHDASGHIYPVLFDDKTGLYILGSSEEEDARGTPTSLEITTYVEP